MERVEWGVREESGRTTPTTDRRAAEEWIDDEEYWNQGERRWLVRRRVSAWSEVAR